MSLLCAVPFKHFPLLLRQLFKQCPNPSRVSGKARRLHVIVKREPLLWNNRFPLAGIVHIITGLFPHQRTQFLDPLTDLPGNPGSLSAPARYHPELWGVCGGRKLLKPFSII